MKKMAELFDDEEEEEDEEECDVDDDDEEGCDVDDEEEDHIEGGDKSVDPSASEPVEVEEEDDEDWVVENSAEEEEEGVEAAAKAPGRAKANDNVEADESLEELIGRYVCFMKDNVSRRSVIRLPASIHPQVRAAVRPYLIGYAEESAKEKPKAVRLLWNATKVLFILGEVAQIGRAHV